MTIKHVSLLLAVLLLSGGVITWLGGSVSRSHAGATGSAVIPRDATDDPAQKLTISWLGMPQFASAHEGLWIERMLEQRFNVELKPNFMDGNAYSNQRPLMYCGGEVPDVAWEGDPVTVQRYARHGFLAELPYAVILKYAPTYAKSLNENAPVAWLYSYWNGKNYGLPTLYLTGRYPECGVWRKDWLRNVGIANTPETLDEMHTALYRFRHNDPDRDGKMDTYGISCDLTNWWTYFGDVFGAYGNIPYGWMMRDGQVVWGGTQPEAKAALATLRQWYREGIIDPDFVTDTIYGTVTTKFINNRLGYVPNIGSDPAMYDRTSDNPLAKSFRELNPSAELAPGVHPQGPGGRGMRVWGSGGHIIVFSADTAKHPEKVIRVLKMFEAMTKDDQLALASACGQQGVQWDYRDPKIGKASGIKRLPPYDDPNRATMNVLTSYTGGDNFRGFFCQAATPPQRVDQFLLPKALAFRNTYCRPAWGHTDLFGKPDVVPSSGEYMADLRSLQTTVYAEIIRGDQPLSAFDDFVKEWRRRGGDRMLREAQELQQAKVGIYQQLGVPIEKALQQ